VLDKSNNPVTNTRLGEVLTVRLRIRSLRKEWISNVALIDLLPGGFEVVSSSLTPGVSESRAWITSMSRDRAIFYATVPTETLEITYQISRITVERSSCRRFRGIDVRPQHEGTRSRREN